MPIFELREVINFPSLKAVFYAKEDYENTQIGADLKYQPLELYYYYNKKEERWYIKNLLKPTGGSHRESFKSKGEASLSAGQDKQFPKELVKELNDVSHLPKGWIYYQMPDGTPGDAVYVDGHWGATEWLKAIGVTVAILGAIATGVGVIGASLEGAAIAAGGTATATSLSSGWIAAGTYISVAGGGMVAISGVREFVDIQREGRGDALSYTSAMLDIVGGILGTVNAFLPKLVNIELGAGQMVYMVTQTAEAGANSVGLVLTTEGGLRGLIALYQNRHKKTTLEVLKEGSAQLLYLMAQNYVAFRTVKGNVQQLKAIRETRVGVATVQKSGKKINKKNDNSKIGKKNDDNKLAEKKLQESNQQIDNFTSLSNSFSKKLQEIQKDLGKQNKLLEQSQKHLDTLNGQKGADKLALKQAENNLAEIKTQVKKYKSKIKGGAPKV